MLPQEEVMSAVKQRLENYGLDDREIENQLERLERLETKMTQVGAQVITDMPRAPSPATDRMSDYIAQKDRLEERIRELQAVHRTDRSEIERISEKLRDPDERAVILIRYVDITPWSEVSDQLFGAKKDYLYKQETYLRRTYALHKSALEKLTDYIMQTKDPFVPVY